MCQIEWCWLLLCEREVSCSPASGRCTSLHVVFNWIYLPFIFSLKPNFKVIKLTPVSFVWSLPESTLVCHTIYVANRILFAVFNRFVARHRFCFLSCRRLRFGRRLIVFCLLSLTNLTLANTTHGRYHMSYTSNTLTTHYLFLVLKLPRQMLLCRRAGDF